jgi:biopolymer transport protein TolQ
MNRVVLAVLLFLAAAMPGFAQSAPQAVPTGPAAQSQQLGAPDAAPGAIDVSAVGSELSSFSIVSMFERADIIVQAVMILLLVASLWSWGIIFNKLTLLAGLKRKARRFEKIFWSGQSLDELYQQFSGRNDHPMAAMFLAAMREWRRAFEGGPPRESQVGGIKDRIDKSMNVTIMRETDSIEKQLGLLATIGSVSPFIGLFGTVWGIMNSFSAIAARHDTTLAVVAPGIAEALFATAMGLLAAIPAVIFYNRFVSEIGRYVNSLDAFADEFSTILSRQLDEKVK